MWDARRPSLHRNLCAKHLVGFLTRSLLAKLDIFNFYLPRNSCQNQPRQNDRIRNFSIRFARPRLTKTTRRSRASRRGKRGSMIIPRMKKGLLRFTEKPPKKTPRRLKLRSQSRCPPAEEPPRAPCRGVRREISPSGLVTLRFAAPHPSSRNVLRTFRASQDCRATGHAGHPPGQVEKPTEPPPASAGRPSGRPPGRSRTA